MGVQLQEDLAVRKSGRKNMGGVDCERALADPAMPSIA